MRDKGKLAHLCIITKAVFKKSNVITGVCKETNELMMNQVHGGSAGAKCGSRRKRNDVLIINPKRTGEMFAHFHAG